MAGCYGGIRPVTTAWQVATGRGATDAPVIRHTSTAAQSGLYQTAGAGGIRLDRNEAIAILMQGQPIQPTPAKVGIFLAPELGGSEFPEVRNWHLSIKPNVRTAKIAALIKLSDGLRLAFQGIEYAVAVLELRGENAYRAVTNRR